MGAQKNLVFYFPEGSSEFGCFSPISQQIRMEIASQISTEY